MIFGFLTLLIEGIIKGTSNWRNVSPPHAPKAKYLGTGGMLKSLIESAQDGLDSWLHTMVLSIGQKQAY